MKRGILFVSAATASVLVAYLSASRGLAFPARGATGSARIVVTVELSGTAPAPAKIQASADAYCAVAHQTDALLSQTVQVGAHGALINALVFVKDGVSGTYRAPQTPVTLAQKGCVFLPHVIGMMAGQALQIVNSDPTLHTVHPMTDVNASFNIGMPIQGMKQNRVFAEPEPAFRVKCDVHPWMSAYIATFAHPFFGVSNRQGIAELSNLPAGTFQIQAWHEKYGVQTQSVSVSVGETKQITVTYKG
jgi:plastocyanin